MKLNTILLLLVTSILTACGPKINNEQQESLAQLTENVNASVAIITNIDSAELIQLSNSFMETKEYLLNGINDTLDRSTIFFLDSFVNLRKSVSYMSKEYEPLKLEALAMQEQLKTLNQDVENRLVDEEHFEKYYGLEQNNYLQLKFAVNQLNKIHTEAVENYNRMKPRVDKIVEASKANANE